MFDIKLVAYKPFGDRIGELPQPLSIEVGDPLSDMPSMRLKYSRDAIGAELLDKDIEIAMEVYDPNTRRWSEPPNGRFLRVRVEGDTLDPIDGIQYMFPGYSWLLTRVRIYPLSATFVKGQVQDATATEKAARAALDTAEDNVLRALGMKLDTRVEFEKGYPDSQKSVWIDVSDLKKPVVKTYVSNQWKTANAASQTAAVNAVNKWVEHQQTQGQLADVQDRSRLTKRSFTGRHAGSVFAELLGEAKQRGRLSGLTYKFTTTHDSAGKPWPTQTGVVQVNTGTDLGALLTTFVEGGQLDFRTQGRELQVYVQDTVMNRTPAENLILRHGLQIDEAPDRSTLENLAGEVLFMGDDGLMFTRSNPEAMAPWGVWESSTSQSGIKTEAAGQVYAKTALAEAAGRRVERTRGLQFHEDVLAPLPYVHYLPGDYIFAPGANGKSERQRVQQITLTKDGTKGGVQGNLVLNDRFLEAEIRNSRRVQAITNGSSIGGTGSVPDREQYVDLRTPNAPRYVRGTGEGEYIKNLGFKAFISAEWFWDGNATNGTSMEDGLSKYEVQYRLVNSGTLGDTSNAMTWFKAPDASGDDPSITFGPVDGWNVRANAGATYELRVRAVAHNGKVSAWSRVAALQVSGDAIPPTPPSRPSVRAEGSVIWVEWDGKMESGGQPPSDFFSIQIHEAEVPEGAPTADDGSIADSYLDTLPYSLVESAPLTDTGSAPVFDREYGVNYAYKLTATDFFGNQSEMSPPAGPVHTVPLVDDTFLQEQLERARQESEQQQAELARKLEEANEAIGASNERLDGVVDSVSQAEEAAVASEQKAAAAQAAADQASSDAGDAVSKATAAQTAADQAKATAGTADQAARAASGLAATKGETIYQASAPTGSRAAAQNLWIRTTDNKPHTWNGTSWVAVTDKAATDAASAASVAQSAASTAQATANQAKADAATASQNAIDAMTKAGQAQTSADGKNTITRATSPASQMGKTVGDTHFTMSSMGGGGVVTRQQRWDGNTWQDESLSHQVIASLDLGKATVGELDGGRIAARTLSSDRFTVGVAGNLIVDPNFNNPVISGWRASGRWQYDSTGTEACFRAVSDGTITNMSLTGADTRDPILPVTSGTSYALTLDMIGQVQIYLKILYANGTVQTPGSSLQTAEYSANRRKETFTVVPDDYTHSASNGTFPVSILIYLRQPSNAPVGTETVVYSAKFAPRAGTVLIENGAITGEKVNARSVAAATGKFLSLDVGQLTTTGTANINEAVVNNLWAKKIATEKVYANEVTIGQGPNLVPNGMGDLATVAPWTVYQGSELKFNTQYASINKEVGATQTFSVRGDSPLYGAIVKSGTFKATPNETYAVRFSVLPTAQSLQTYADLTWYNSSGAVIQDKSSGQAWDTWSVPIEDSRSLGYGIAGATRIGEWNSFQGVVVSPPGAVKGMLTVSIYRAGASDTGPGEILYFGGVEIRAANKGNLIVDGSITTRHLNAQTMDITKVLRANSIEAQYLKVDQIKDAVRIDSDIFNGRLYRGAIFQGGQFRTHDSIDKGIALFASGMRVTNPNSGVRTFDINAATGDVSIVGEFSTAPIGQAGIKILNSASSWNNSDLGIWFTLDGNAYGWGTGKDTATQEKSVAGVFLTPESGDVYWNTLRLRGRGREGDVMAYGGLSLRPGPNNPGRIPFLYMNGSGYQRIIASNELQIMAGSPDYHTDGKMYNGGGDIRMWTGSGASKFYVSAGGNVDLMAGVAMGFTVADGQGIYLNSSGRTRYNSPGSTGGTLKLRSDGRIQEDYSSRRWKTDIETSGLDERFLNVRPVTYMEKPLVETLKAAETWPRPLTKLQTDELQSLEMNKRALFGAIAEEVEELGLCELVNYDQEGLPASLRYDVMALKLLPFVKELWEFKKKNAPILEELEPLLPKLRELAS